MAPHKTYGVKKRHLSPVIKTGKIKKTHQNARKPLATLQYTNVSRSEKELIMCKAPQKTICVKTIAVDKRNVSVSSPSFPGSEELSSIWNSDSTFDKLLQTSTKQIIIPKSIKTPESALKDAEKKTSPMCNSVTKTDRSLFAEPLVKYTPSSRCKTYKLRSYGLLRGKQGQFLQSLDHDCLGCSNKSTSCCKSYSEKNVRQITSTPNITGISTNPNIMDFTPIYPEALRSITEAVCDLLSSHESLVDTPKLSCSRLSQPKGPPEHILLEAKSPKTTTCCNDAYSPDMFSGFVASSHFSPRRRKCVCPSLLNSSSKNQSSNSDDNTNSYGSDKPLRKSDNLEMANSSVKKPIANSRNKSIWKLSTEAPNLPLNVKLGCTSTSVSIGEKLISSINTTYDSKSYSKELKSKLALNDSDSVELDCLSNADGRHCNSIDNSLHGSKTHSSKFKLKSKTAMTDSDSMESDSLIKEDVSIDSSHLKSLESVHPSTVTDTGISTNSNFIGEFLVSKSSETENDCGSASSLEHDEGTADSLSSVYSLKARLSVIDSESENSSYLAPDEKQASPVMNYVNLRNRKVRWKDHSLLKNCSGKLEWEDHISAGENLEPATVSGLATESEQACCETVSKKELLTVRPSVAFSKRPSMRLSSRSRAASRRFSVAPGKLLAKPRQDSHGFRDLHGILAPPVTKMDGFCTKLSETTEDFSAVSIAENPKILAEESITITARDVVLQKCRQEEPIPFDDIMPEKYLSQCRKIGEGLYGEVFMWKSKDQSSVLKIIPIAGDELINGEHQKTFDEILSEIVITKELSDLRHAELAGVSEDLTSGFVEVKRTACVIGKYPPRLLQLWQEFADESGTENDNPEVFSETQLFIVLELANGGADLEKFQFNNSSQALSVFLQTAYALAAAERRIEFEHRDLHWGNVLVSKTNVKHYELNLNGTAHKVQTNGVQVSIIDFTLSRMTYDGCCIYNDLSQDDSLFVSVGDYQFDIYRRMRENCRNDWREFVPANNVLWLHYIVDKMLSGVHYRRTSSKVHRDNLKTLSSIKEILLDFTSTADFLESRSKDCQLDEIV